MGKTIKANLAEIKKEKLLVGRYLQIYDVLVKKYPKTLTPAEINAFIGYEQSHSRLNELEKRGVVIREGKVVCNLTGRAATKWQAVNTLPQVIVKTVKHNPIPTLKFRNLEVEKRNIKLQKENAELKVRITKAETRVEELTSLEQQKGDVLSTVTLDLTQENSDLRRDNDAVKETYKALREDNATLMFDKEALEASVDILKTKVFGLENPAPTLQPLVEKQGFFRRMAFWFFT